mmetsp:Transcript_8672/g.32675  ORF Transcript_8672/g.32675 Transcript_8672/m.32675 type:complete len:101 (+) Transcript_8672:1639-1941(+)
MFSRWMLTDLWAQVFANNNTADDIPSFLRSVSSRLIVSPGSVEAPLRFLLQWCHGSWLLFYLTAIVYQLRAKRKEEEELARPNQREASLPDRSCLKTKKS